LLLNQTATGNSDGPKIQFRKTMASTKSWTAGMLNGVDVGSFSINEDAGTFGFGTPRLAIKSGGNVGIGNTDPSYILDVSQRMRIRSGSYSAGLWLNNNSNTEAAFIGMEDDTHVGLYGQNGAGWKLSMNTQTGALKINGSEGTAGQVLKSNGSGAPSWVSSTNTLYNNTIQLIANTYNSIVPDDTYVPLSGLSYSFSTTVNVKVLIMFNLNLYPGYCVACEPSGCNVGIFINDVLSANPGSWVFNATNTTLSYSYLKQLGPGNHTIQLRGRKVGPATYFTYLGGVALVDTNNMIVQIIPE